MTDNKLAEQQVKKLADERFQSWSDLHSRMDSDNDLINMEGFTLLDTDGKAVPNSVSVTLNDIAVFVDKVEAALGSSDEQITVESEDKGVDTDYVEDFIGQTFTDADELLSMRGEVTFNPFTDQMTCRKGRAAARCVFQFKGDRITTEIIPLDVQFEVYGMDEKGLQWHSYKMERDRDSIEAEYPDITLTTNKKTFVVQDIWTRDANYIWVDNVLAENQTHNWGMVPVCVQVVPKGSISKVQNNIKHQGESLLYMIRDLVPELNRLVSIIQSMNMQALDRALQLKVPPEDLPLAHIPEHDVVSKPNAVTAVPSSGGFDLMPLGELQQHAYLLQQMIEQRIQRGGVSNFDMGTFAQPMSAVALVQIGEGRDQTFLPRLGTRGLLKRQIAKQLIKRTLDTAQSLGVSSIQVGEYEYEVAKLKGNYNIDFKYFSKNPAVDVARYTIAQAAGTTVSEYTKRRDIIQLQDPDGEERRILIEKANLLFPELEKYDTLIALNEEANKGDKQAEFKRDLALEMMGLTLEQVLAGNIQQTVPEAPKKPAGNPLVPLMGSGGTNAAVNALGSNANG